MTAPIPDDITTPVPDAFQEAMRAAVVNAIQDLTTRHQALYGQMVAAKAALDQTQAALAQTQQALDALTARVAALETPTA